MTDESKALKERLMELAEKYGIKSIRQLSLSAGITNQNLYSNINGTYDISIKRLFKLASVMKCDISEVINVFYPELYAENQKEKNVPVEGE